MQLFHDFESVCILIILFYLNISLEPFFNLYESLSIAYSIWSPSYLVNEFWEGRDSRPILICKALSIEVYGTICCQVHTWGECATTEPALGFLSLKYNNNYVSKTVL